MIAAAASTAAIEDTTMQLVETGKVDFDKVGGAVFSAAATQALNMGLKIDSNPGFGHSSLLHDVASAVEAQGVNGMVQLAVGLTRTFNVESLIVAAVNGAVVHSVDAHFGRTDATKAAWERDTPQRLMISNFLQAASSAEIGQLFKI